METHMAFFSRETHQVLGIDPQIFVKATDSPAGAGAQNIVHVAGFRNASAADPGATEAYNAQGKDLGFTLGRWFGAQGTVSIADQTSAHPHVTASFLDLIPRGVYSLFENHFAAPGVTFTPLDGSGKTNTFTAKSDGSATVHVEAADALTAADAILLVYHSDGKAHALLRGEPGVTAHHQLIVRIPDSYSPNT